MRHRSVVLAAGAAALAGMIAVVHGPTARTAQPARPEPPAGEAPPAAVSSPSAVAPSAAAPAPRPADGAAAPLAAARRSSDLAPGEAGMVVAIDPESGRLGPPEREAFRALTIDELQALARREAEGLVTVRHADGSEHIDHEGRFADHALITVDAAGTPRFLCTHGEHAARHALRAGRPVPPALEEE